jgi:hypothetical protein
MQTIKTYFNRAPFYNAFIRHVDCFRAGNNGLRRDPGTIPRGTANQLQTKLLLRAANFTANRFQTIPMALSTHFHVRVFIGHDPECGCQGLLPKSPDSPNEE